MIFPKKFNRVFKLMLKCNPDAKKMVKKFLRNASPLLLIKMLTNRSFEHEGIKWNGELELEENFAEFEVGKSAANSYANMLINVEPIAVDNLNSNTLSKIFDSVPEAYEGAEVYPIQEIGGISFAFYLTDDKTNKRTKLEIDYTFQLNKKDGKLHLSSWKETTETIIAEPDEINESASKDCEIVKSNSEQQSINADNYFDIVVEPKDVVMLLKSDDDTFDADQDDEYDL